MTMLKNTQHFPRIGYNLIEDYFIDITISRYNLVLKDTEAT